VGNAHAKLTSFERAIERRLIQLYYETPPVMGFVGLDANGLAEFERITKSEGLQHERASQMQRHAPRWHGWTRTLLTVRQLRVSHAICSPLIELLGVG
jgi:hypothetical protein